MDEKDVVLIAGATASGKSALALELAQRCGGVIINADSMQVYADLRVLTARPSREDEACAPHRLYGHVPAEQAYSVAQWLSEAAAQIASAHDCGQTAIVVGGTGLYFKALTEGLSPIPAIADDIRAHWRGEAAVRGAEELHADLAVRDPETAGRLNSSDMQRIVRALEVIESTGQSLAAWQRIKGRPVVEPDSARCLLVERPREEIYRRCDARFEAMVRTGALEEVAALAGKNLAPGLPAMRALAVGPLMQHVSGDLPLDEALAMAKRETRQYVKRQLTWQRRFMIAWDRV